VTRFWATVRQVAVREHPNFARQENLLTWALFRGVAVPPPESVATPRFHRVPRVSAKSRPLLGIAAFVFVVLMVSDQVFSDNITFPSVEERALPIVAAPTFPPIEMSATQSRVVITDETLFPAGSSEVTAIGKLTLEQVLTELPDVGPIEVHGYTDGVGSTQYNLRLSQERADAVEQWLIAAGVAPSRLVATGHGEEGAIDNVDDPHMRRVEITFAPGADR
jgi:outer membrane protein OmpA-like peptidoglycan-associated protein